MQKGRRPDRECHKIQEMWRVPTAGKGEEKQVDMLGPEANWTRGLEIEEYFPVFSVKVMR